MKTILDLTQQFSSILIRFAALCMVLLFTSTVSKANCTDGDAPKPQLTMQSTAACFSVTNNGHTVGQATVFVNESVDANSYKWYFGDGNSSSAYEPTHTYQSAGTYTVRLIVTGAGGTSEFIGTVDVIAN